MEILYLYSYANHDGRSDKASQELHQLKCAQYYQIKYREVRTLCLCAGCLHHSEPFGQKCQNPNEWLWENKGDLLVHVYEKAREVSCCTRSLRKAFLDFYQYCSSGISNLFYIKIPIITVLGIESIIRILLHTLGW